MADLKKLAEELVNLTVKDVNELAEILKEEYGIEPAAAAVAVAGLTTTASAKSLEDSIKNVEISGMMRLRFESLNDGSANERTDTDNDFDTEIKFVNKVNDKSSIVIIPAMLPCSSTTTAMCFFFF